MTKDQWVDLVPTLLFLGVMVGPIVALIILYPQGTVMYP